MNRRRHVCGLLVLVLLSAVVVPLQLSLFGIDASGAMTHEKRVRMIHISQAHLLVCLCLQVGAGWLLYSALPIRKTLYARVLWFVGMCLVSVVCSCVCGILITLLGWPDWDRLAWRLIS